MLELDPRAGRALDDEPDLDLAGSGVVGLELPLKADIPAEHDPVRRLVGEHAGPSTLAAVDASVDDVAADEGLEHHLLQVGLQDVVLGRPPRPDVVGEHTERLVDRRLHDDRRGDRGVGDLCSHCSSCCSTLCLNDVSALIQNRST